MTIPTHINNEIKYLLINFNAISCFELNVVLQLYEMSTQKIIFFNRKNNIVNFYGVKSLAGKKPKVKKKRLKGCN